MARAISPLASLTISASVAAAQVTIPACRLVRVTNGTAVYAFASVGSPATAAAGTPIAPGQFVDFIVHQNTTVSAILASSTGNVYVTPVTFFM